MTKRFLTNEAKTALTDAVKAIEARSSAEIVIAVRARSDRYLSGSIVVGIVLGLAALAFVLFSSRFSFPLWTILVDPLVVGLVTGFAASRVPAASRALMLSSHRDEAVRHAAQSTFFEKGVRHTQDRIGVLVYVSLLERRLELIGDVGVEKAVGPADWKQAGERLDALVRSGCDGQELAKALLDLGDLLEPVLERAEDDVNELPDEVCG